jgi:hypothetical protein
MRLSHLLHRMIVELASGAAYTGAVGRHRGRCLELSVTQTDSVNERPPIQEGSQSEECNADHDPDHSCVGEDQDDETDQCCNYPESSHGVFSHSADAVDVSVLLLCRPTTAGRLDTRRPTI